MASTGELSSTPRIICVMLPRTLIRVKDDHGWTTTPNPHYRCTRMNPNEYEYHTDWIGGAYFHRWAMGGSNWCDEHGWRYRAPSFFTWTCTHRRENKWIVLKKCEIEKIRRNIFFNNGSGVYIHSNSISSLVLKDFIVPNKEKIGILPLSN
jgi:hypothetical protein